MRFAVEIWLWLVPLIPLLWLLLRHTDQRAKRRLGALLGPVASRHVEGDNPRLRAWRRFFVLGGFFWLLLALARPQWGASEVTVTQQGSDIVVALDISNSMLAEDVPPNRMERAKAELGSFLGRLEDSRIGLVFFAGSAFVQCPLTLDYGTADIFLKMAGPDMLSEQGTAIGAALETSRELLAKGREGEAGGSFQAVLLVTDGEDLEGAWEKEAKALLADGVRLIPVGVGEESGGLIPVFDNRGRPAGFMKDEQDNVVMTRLDLAALNEMANISGGSPFRIGVDGLAGDRLFAELKRLGRRDLEERRISAFQERYLIPLLLAMVCFALPLVLGPRQGKRTGRAARTGLTGAACFLAVTCLGLPGIAGPIPAGSREMAAGMDKYRQGAFEEALGEFESALVQAPDNPLISLAVGEALYQLERYPEAANEFERALQLADDQKVQSEALYNAGTAYLAAGDPAKAAEALRRSLALDPAQDDALFNLEVALRRQEQQEQEQQDQEEQDQEEQDQEEQDQEEQDQDQQNQEEQDQDQQDQDQQDQEQQDQDQQDQEQQDQDQQNQEEQDQEQQDQDQQEQEQQDLEQQEQEQQEQETDPADEQTEELSQEQALQILQALDRDEEELKRSVQKRLKGGRPQSGKKW